MNDSNNEKKSLFGLDEIKKLTLGRNAPKNPTPEQMQNENQKSQIEKDVEAFKEEQKIFTQINATKELPSQSSYAVPKELKRAAEEKEKSAFEKLLSLSKSDLNEDKKTGTITTPNYSKPVVFAESEEKVVSTSGKSVELKKEEEVKPKITEQKTGEQKEGTQTLAKKTIGQETHQWRMKKETTEKPKSPELNQKTMPPKEYIQKTQQKKVFPKTPIDQLFELLEKMKMVDIAGAATILNIDSGTIEQIAKRFESDGIVEIEYPASLTKKPLIKLKTSVPSKLFKIPKGKIIESYEIEVDYITATINIILPMGEARPIYAIEMPAIGKYTKRFLDFVKEEVAENMPIDLEEILDPKKSKKLKDRFFNELTARLQKYFPKASREMLLTMSGVLLHEMYGLGDIEVLLGDDKLEEVGINSSKTPITIYHRVHGWLQTNILPGTEEDINNLSSQIGRKVGRDITVLNPILDAHLLSGDRVNATLFPISSEGNTITIRRFARKPWTIIDFIGNAHTMNPEMAAILWLAMQYEMNIIIAGGTASGKTSTLNTILALVPTYHRLISIEDVREIILPKHLEWNWIPMVTRSANPEGLGEVTMLDLMVTSLRMRPDRIIVGEMRRKKEAEVLMEAIETGHSIYSTIHANSAYQVLRRLAEPPMSIPLMQIELIDLIVVQYRDRKTNKRRTYEIAEVEQTSTGQGLQVNTVYKWTPRNDSWEKLNKPIKLITLLNMHTGMTEDEIDREIEQRVQILKWMQRQNITDIDAIGFLVKLFYSLPEEVKKMVQRNATIQEVQKIAKSGTTGQAA